MQTLNYFNVKKGFEVIALDPSFRSFAPCILSFVAILTYFLTFQSYWNEKQKWFSPIQFGLFRLIIPYHLPKIS